MNNELPFGKLNYFIMVGGLVLIGLGFMLMSGGQSESRDVFNPEVFSTTRIAIAPIVVLLGLGVVGFSIFFKPKSEEN